MHDSNFVYFFTKAEETRENLKFLPNGPISKIVVTSDISRS